LSDAAIAKCEPMNSVAPVISITRPLPPVMSAVNARPVLGGFVRARV
jgi:hypothetical protein